MVSGNSTLHCLAINVCTEEQVQGQYNWAFL